MIHEGGRVAYAGYDGLNEPGAMGKVISTAGSSSVHVLWQTGPKQGTVELLPVDDLLDRGHEPKDASLTAATLRESFDYDLNTPPPPPITVRALYDEGGEPSVLGALEEAGRIAVLAEYGDQAVEFLATQIRRDPAIGEVLAQLDPEEGASLVGRVASLVLMDRLSTEEE